MQTEITNATQNAKLKIKYANRNMQDNNKTKQNDLKVKMDKMMLTQVQPPQAQVFAQVGDEVDFVVIYSSTSPQATEPESMVHGLKLVGQIFTAMIPQQRRQKTS